MPRRPFPPCALALCLYSLAFALAPSAASPDALAAASTSVAAAPSGPAGAGSPDATRRRPLFLEGGRWVPYAAGTALLVATDRHTQSFLLHAFGGSDTRRVSKAAGTLGTAQVYLGTPLLLYALGGKHEKRAATRIVNALITSGLVTEATKTLLGRRRPDEPGAAGDFIGPSLDHKSLPSGHTSAAFALATVMASEYPRYRVPLYVLAAAVAASRVLQNRHFTSDVVVGAGVGIAAGQQAARGGDNLLGFRF